MDVIFGWSTGTSFSSFYFICFLRRTCAIALNDNNNIAIFVIKPANKISWDRGFCDIKDALITNSINSNIRAAIPNGKEIKGIIDCAF